ncbi:MAG: VanW family protein [Clostridia bacterium]|nr:VanW family protein [Clostridia bacterium]
MNKRKKVILSLLFTGSFFLSCLALCGFTIGKVKSGVVANGLEVGGMSVKEAAQRVRENIAENLLPLTVITPTERVTVTYPELSFMDDAERILRSAKKGASVTVRPVRQWANAESRIQSLCDKNARLAIDAELSFSASGFTYQKEKEGLVCDYGETLDRVFSALEKDEREVEMATHAYVPALTQEILKERTKLLSSYTTRFDASNESRVHNIRLAAEKIAGTTLLPRAEFSFNQCVGKRTAENGFKESVVIFDGEFVKGVGGGVCQMSTTLFNAALRAGMHVTESRNHSLSVSYVPPSLDAMVSEYSDLKFVNPFDTPVYLNAVVRGGSVTVECYGLPDG